MRKEHLVTTAFETYHPTIEMFRHLNQKMKYLESKNVFLSIKLFFQKMN